MEEQLRRVISTNDVISHLNLVHAKMSGTYLVTIISKENVTYFKKDNVLITISIENYGEYSIVQPLGDIAWNNLGIGTTFVLDKQIFKPKKSSKNRAKLVVRYVFPEGDISNSIQKMDISELAPKDKLYAKIIQLSVLKATKDELLVYTNNYLCRIVRNFTFDNISKIDISFGKMFYASKEIDDKRRIQILSDNLFEARKYLYTNSGSEKTQLKYN